MTGEQDHNAAMHRTDCWTRGRECPCGSSRSPDLLLDARMFLLRGPRIVPQGRLQKHLRAQRSLVSALDIF